MVPKSLFLGNLSGSGLNPPYPGTFSGAQSPPGFLKPTFSPVLPVFSNQAASTRSSYCAHYDDFKTSAKALFCRKYESEDHSGTVVADIRA